MTNEKSKNLHNQQYIIKFCVKHKKTVTETKEMLDAAYSESVILQGSVYRWYKKFKDGRKNVELMGRTGAPMTALTKLINTGTTLILDNPHLTVRHLASLLDIW